LTRYGDVEAANYFAQAVELAKVIVNMMDKIKLQRINYLGMFTAC